MHTREQSSKTQLLLLKYIGGFHLFRNTNVCSNKTFFLVVIVFVHDGILMAKAYLWGILGQWDILLLNLTSIGFTNFFRCLIFDLSFFTNADVVTIKDIKDIQRKFVKPMQVLLTSIGFTIFLDVSSLTFPFSQMLML